MGAKSVDAGMETPEAGSNQGSLQTRRLGEINWDGIRHFAVQAALASVLVAVTTGAIYTLAPLIDLRHVPAVYFVPVLGATLYWGFLEGLITAFASAVAAAFCFYDPIFSFYVSNPVELVGLLIFVAAAIVIGYLA